MAAIVLTLISVPSAQASGDTQRVTAKVAPETAAVSERTFRDVQGIASASRSAQGVLDGNVRPGRSETCRSARIAAVYFRFRTWTHQELRDGRLASKSPIVAGKSCHWAKFAAVTWEARARSARRSFYRWLNDRTLRDFAFAPGADAWPKAVREVQRVFPNSDGWTLSCSDAEGWSPGFDRWVVYGGGPYYAGAEYAKGGAEVGGPGQYTYGTFAGHFRRGVDYLLAKGYRLPPGFPRHANVTAWRTALGQAIAMGAAYHLGLRGNHWSASHGTGC